jgi:hypothetical protein
MSQKVFIVTDSGATTNKMCAVGENGERTNVSAAQPEIVARLTKLLEKYIAAGRSTPGKAETNDVPVSIQKKLKGEKPTES